MSAKTVYAGATACTLARSNISVKTVSSSKGPIGSKMHWCSEAKTENRRMSRISDAAS